MLAFLKLPVGWLVAVVIALLAFIVTLDFAYSDDYLYAHWFGHLGMDAGESQFFMHGRPVLYYLMEVVFSRIHTVPDMAYVRLLALLGLVCFGAVAYRLGLFLGLSKNHSALLALAGCLNPASMVFLGFASTYSYSWCAALALWLNLRLLSRDLRFSWTTALTSAYCVIVLFIILLIYQPMAFLFLIPATLAVIVCGIQRRTLFTWCLSLVIIFTSIGLYFCYIKLIGSWAYTGHPGYLRGGFDFDFLKKFTVISSNGIIPTLKSWGIFSSAGYGLLAVYLSLIAFGIIWRCSPRRILVNLAVVTICLATLFIPVLASKDVFLSFRILHGVYFFMTAFGVFGLFQLLSLKYVRQGAIPFVSTISVSLLVSAASLYYFYFGIVKPHHEEYLKYQAHIFTHFHERPWHVSFHSGYIQNYVPSIIPDRLEYGTIASKAAWSHMGIINLIVNEKFGFDKKAQPVWVDSCHHTLVGSTFHTLFLDADAIMRGKQSAPASQRSIGDAFIDPTFGELTKTGADQYYSVLYGTIDAAAYPTLSVENIGKGRPEGRVGNGFWFYLDYTRMIQVDPSLLPIVFDVTSNQWLPISDL